VTNESSTRAAAIELLRAGLATQSEVAELAGVSRQLVAYWAKQGEIDPGEARQRWLNEAWRRLIKTYP